MLNETEISHQNINDISGLREIAQNFEPITFLRYLTGSMKYNGEKWMTITVYFYTAFYRLYIRFVPMPKIEKGMGVQVIRLQMERHILNLHVV